MSADLLPAPHTHGPASPLLLTTDLAAGRLTVVGELDRGSAHRMLDAVEALAYSDRPTWTVDAAGISFCDAEGLRVLARAHALARSHGRVLVLDRPPRFLLRLLDAVEMGHLFDRSPTGD